jgi:signal transduction histidine kinase
VNDSAFSSNIGGATSAPRPPSRWRDALASVRTRTLAAYIVLLTLSLAVVIFLLRQLLIVQLDEEINNSFTQEYREFSRLVKGNDPNTGRPFGSDLKAIFDVFLSRNIPEEEETLIGFVDGEYYDSRDAAEVLYPLQSLPDAVERWTSLDEPRRGTVRTPAGEARYLAAPIRFQDEVRGTFVVAKFPQSDQAEIDTAIRTAIQVSAAVLGLASFIAWVLAGRVISPLRDLSDTVRTISETDLTRRIPVQGSDEISQLAARFNAMLDRLEAAFAGQRQFTADASHELRTPITIIRGQLEVMGDDPEEREEAMAIVFDELDRMGRLVDDLLVLARAKQPDFLHVEAVNVASLTDDLHSKARSLAPRTWKLESKGSGIVEADRHRLTQAVIQLAQNAVQHTSKGAEIAVGSALNDGRLQLWVRDSGPGIAPEDQERIFDRFTRSSDRRRNSDGAGLGLSIVRAIAEAHSGSVHVISRRGAGATFTMEIPAHKRTMTTTDGGRA